MDAISDKEFDDYVDDLNRTHSEELKRLCDLIKLLASDINTCPICSKPDPHHEPDCFIRQIIEGEYPLE